MRRGRPPIARLDDLTKGALVTGVVADHAVTVVDVSWHGSEVLTLTYRTADGAVAERLVYRDDEPRLAIVEEGWPWAFDGDAANGDGGPRALVDHGDREPVRARRAGPYARRGRPDGGRSGLSPRGDMLQNCYMAENPRPPESASGGRFVLRALVSRGGFEPPT